MSFFKSKISNLTSKTTSTENHLHKHLASVDVDLQNLFKIAAPYYQFGTGTGFYVIIYSGTGYSFVNNIAGWHIGASTFSSTSIVLDAGDNSIYANYTPTTSGFKITATWSDFTNLTVTNLNVSSERVSNSTTSNLTVLNGQATFSDLTVKAGGATFTNITIQAGYASLTALSATQVSSTNLTANTATITNLSGVTGSYTHFGVTGSLSAGTATIGDGTNQTKFESDGTLVLEGTATVWEDINMGSMELGTAVSGPDPVNISSTNLQLLGFDGNVTLQQAYGAIEIQHNYKEGTDITPHIHWMPSTDSAGNVKWQMEYYIFSDGVANHTSTTLAVSVSATELAWSATRTDFAIIPGANRVMGDQIVFRIFRDPGDAADDYPDDALLATIGFHYQIDTIGSRLITTK